MNGLQLWTVGITVLGVHVFIYVDPSGTIFACKDSAKINSKITFG